MASSKNRLARGQAWALSAFALLASLVCFPSLVSAAQAPAGSYFQCQIDPMAESNFSLALFRIWLPPVEKGPIKGVLAVLPGSDAHGTPLADDPKWQEIAAKWNYGLLAVTFTTKSGAEPYYRAERGSGAAFVAALDELAALSARPELSSAPVAILGHSQGGQFAFHFTCWRPHRTIAFATIKGGFHDARPDAAARDVPGLILAGAKDAEFRRKNLRDLFDANPWPASRWAYVEEPGAGHELGHCLDLIVPFFHTIVTSQIQPYVGRIDDFHVEPANPSLAGLSVWLPSPDVASLWVKLMTNWSSPGADLRIPNHPPPKLATVSPPTHDFGMVIAGREPVAARFDVRGSPDVPAWTSVRAFSSHNRSVVSATSTDEGFLVTAEPQIAGLPLGRLSDTIVLRFTNEGKVVLGGLQIPITLLNTHPDIQVKPASIYVGTHEGPRESTIRVSVSAGQRLTIKSATADEGAAATVEIVEQGGDFAVLKCTFTPSGEPGARTGRFSIHLSEPVDVDVHVPFIGFY